MPQQYQNTRELLGDDGALDALVAHSLTEYNDSEIASIGANAFYYQERLQSIYLPNIASIGNNAFANCSAMQRFFIGLNKSNVVTLSNSNAFTNTGRSIIFVPDSLVSNYRSASQWSTYAGRIFGISDLGTVEWNETEIADTEDEIIAHINAGTAAARYSPGNYKTINLGDGGNIRFQIVAKNVRELADGSGYAQLDWVAMEALPSAYDHRYNPAYSAGVSGTGTLGGFAESEMQTHLDDNVWPLFPEKWRNVIKECKMYTRMYNAAGSAIANDMTTAKLRLPSMFEVGITGYESSGPSYGLAFPDATSRIRKRVGSSSAVAWWSRSANGPDYWIYVYANGTTGNDNATIVHAVVPSFST